MDVNDILGRLSEEPEQFGTPRLHGNGFIQLDLAHDQRFHVWSPDLPRQSVSTQIHDHRFSFSSEVVLGLLSHTVYEVNYGVNETHSIYTAKKRNKDDTVLVKADMDCWPRIVSEVKLAAGSTYTFSWGTFHESGADRLTATIMTKTIVFHSHTPRVLVPKDSEPDNEFDRYAQDEDHLYRTVRGAAAQALARRAGR